MSQALFYLLDQEQSQAPHWHALIYRCLSQAVAEGQRVLLYCQDQEQAEVMDEILWQQRYGEFIAHQLCGEGPKFGTPVEISWPNCPLTGRRQLLINLATEAPIFAVRFPQVVDFVPNDETLKQHARDRYVAYRKQGIHVTTTAAADRPE